MENGRVPVFPHLAFELLDTERRFLDPQWPDRRAKNCLATLTKR